MKNKLLLENESTAERDLRMLIVLEQSCVLYQFKNGWKLDLLQEIC